MTVSAVIREKLGEWVDEEEENMTGTTPTTAHVRAQYARQENYDSYYEGDLFDTPDGQVSAGEFDQWLAEHDAETKAVALEEAAEAYRAGLLAGPFLGRYDYARQWLLARAAEHRAKEVRP